MSSPSSGNIFRLLFVSVCVLSVPGCGPSLPVLVSSTPTQVSIEFEPKKGVRSTSELAEEACAKEGRRAHYVAADGNIVKYDCVGLSLPATVSATQERVAVEFDPTVGVHSTRALAEAACEDVGKPAQFASTEGSIAFYDCLETAVPEHPTPSSLTRRTGEGNLAVLAFRPRSGTYGGLQTQVGIIQEPNETITWQPTRELDLYSIPSQGNCWTIAINDDHIVVAAYVIPSGNSTTEGKVYHRFGRMVKTNQEQWVIHWGPRILGISEKRRGVSIALNNDGVVVEISETSKNLDYRVGDLKKEKLSSSPETCEDENGHWKEECYYYRIKWRTSSPTKYDKGKYPSVALMDDGTVVEVHYTSGAGTKLWSNVGIIRGETIEWRTSGSDRNYTKGKTPSIAVRSDGSLIEVHRANGSNVIWYKLGEVDRDKKKIDWKGKDIKLIEKDARHPSVAVRSSGLVVVTYITKKILFYRLGQANSAWSSINWGQEFQPDQPPVFREMHTGAYEPTVPQITFVPTK